MRLFIAIALDDHLRAAAVGARDGLMRHALRGRPTREDNMHLTLTFLGETAPSRIPDIRCAMEDAADGSFALSLAAPGRFRRDGGDIFWLGIKKTPELTALAGRLASELKRRGFEVEERDYRPHLTLAREVELPRDFHPRAIQVPALSQTVREILLMESARPNGVLTYTPRLSGALDKTAKI